MTLNSTYRAVSEVQLPYQERQKYMHTFDLAHPQMAPGFEDYLEPVTRLCMAVGATHGFAHMTVDERLVQAGMSQRRPYPHVDGCFIPTKGVWGHDGPGPTWNHTCNNIPLTTLQRMAVIVASNNVGCRAWKGRFEGTPRSDGDLSHLVLGEGEVLRPNVGYLLSPDCVHESMIQPIDVERTFLRIALPVGMGV